MRIEVLVFDGLDELDALGPYEVLANASRAGAQIEVALVHAERAGPVDGAHGATLVATETLSRGADVVVVPGGGWIDRAQRGAWAEAELGELPRRLRALHADGATLAGVCTGAMLLATAGILTGRPATTHHAALEELRDAGALVTAGHVVDDGDVVTCGAVTSGLDLALHLVERSFGTRPANAIASRMRHTRRGPVVVRAAGPPD